MKLNLEQREIEWLIEGLEIDDKYFKLNKVAKNLLRKLRIALKKNE